MMNRQPPPPAQGMPPKQYYIELLNQGFSNEQAFAAVQQHYGPPKSQDDLKNEAQNNAWKGDLAQAAGTVGGALGTSYLMSQLATPAATSTVATPTLLGVKTIGAGSSLASGTGATGGTIAGGTATGGTAATGTGSTLSSIGSVALPVAAVLAAASNAWETGMKDILRGRGNRADWANQGVNVLTGGLPNIALRLMGKRSIGAMMTSGKSNAQALRDDFRGDLKESGVADDQYHVTLADGSKFNIGLDGKTKYKNVGTNVDNKTTRNAWDVDFSNPLAKYAQTQIEPMIRKIYGEDNPKAKYYPGQYTGMLVNAATSNAKNEAEVRANISAMLGKSKFAEQAGVKFTPPPPPKAPKGQVVRVSPGMYVNDQGHVGPAKTIKDSLKANYGKSK